MGIYAPLGIARVLGPNVSKLSDKKVQALKPKAKDYRVNDDNGLSCLITPSGNEFWCFRYMWLGREKMLSMGEYPHTSLELARKKTKEIGYLGHRSILSTAVYTDLTMARDRQRVGRLAATQISSWLRAPPIP